MSTQETAEHIIDRPLDVVVAQPGRRVAPRLSDYDVERASFNLEVPERYNPVLHIVETWAAEDPGAPAVLSLDGSGDIVQLDTAASLARASREAARALLELGIGPATTSS